MCSTGGFTNGRETDSGRLSFRDAIPVREGTARAIEFYKNALSASERMRISHPDGRVGHAEFQIGDSVIMLSMNFRRWAHAVPRAWVDHP
jgi:uncharacterized glyoxalase superfamily protein PhnB